MNLNDLLHKENIDPKKVIVLRHRPSERELRKVIHWLAADREELFNAFQSTQSLNVERAMKNKVGKGYVASFIGHEPGKAVFVGLYVIKRCKPLTFQQYWRLPGYTELKSLGMKGWTNVDPNRSTVLWFDLEHKAFYDQWKGKLVVGWPPPELSWCRKAHRNTFPVLSVLNESVLVKAMPDWSKLVVTWNELRVIPSSWQAVLKQWRGIYFIFDESDGKGYIGSAYGKENILGRWLGYAAKGHGGNKLLKSRDPNNFHFSILQRVSPDMPDDEVIRIEGTWKERLHTRQPFGLNEN